MLTKYLVKLKFVHFALLIGAALVFLTACGSGGDTTNNNNAAPTTQVIKAATAYMRHAPSGTVQLMWDHTTHMLNVHLALTGLAPSSVHPAHISAGSCRQVGKAVYPLTNVKAEAIGFADAITKIANVTDGIPTSGWYIDVDNGPGMVAGAQSEPITCADLVNPGAAKTSSQTVQATLMDAYAPDQAATGSSRLLLDHNQLTVIVSLKGLAPNSRHDAHIHTGSCASQGKIVYTLKQIVANAAGDASTTTVVPNVSAIPASGWYVNVHRTMDLSNQTGYDPVVCGDLTPAQ